MEAGPLIQFELWKAEAEYKFRFNEDTGQQERYLANVRKIGTSYINRTWIEQRHADELNTQVENSGFYYYPVKIN